jgi:OLD-like protein
VSGTASREFEQRETPLPRAVILVEGISDRRALEALAARRGRALETDGVVVVAMGGAKNIGRFLERFGPRGSDVALAGLYDVAEEPDVRRGLERAGFGSSSSRLGLERLGFYACIDDLEDELIRAVGAERVIDIVGERGELGPFRTLQKQPEWRGRPIDQQLRRFLGNSNRKIDYVPLLVETLDLSRAPRPMDAVLAHV